MPGARRDQSNWSRCAPGGINASKGNRVGGISNAQRALWALLLILLVAPFFAALVAVTSLLVGALLGVTAGSPLVAAPLGVSALNTYVWAVIPSALTAIGLVPLVLKRGAFGWVEAGAMGVVGFAAAQVLVPLPLGQFGSIAAFAFGLVMVAVRLLLVGKILRP